MNGEIVRNNHSITLLNCKPKSPVHDEMMIKFRQEGRCSLQSDAQRQDEGRRLNPGSLNKIQDSEFTEKRSSYSQCSPCWPDEHASPQIHFSQTYLLSPADGSLAYSKGRSAEPLHTKNCGTRDVRHKKGIRHKAKGNKSTLRGAESKNSQNRKVTDYYPIRRSSRKCKAELKCEQKKHIDDLITNGIEEGLEVQHIEGKGRGVFATRCFQKGEYVVEYHGDLLQITDAKQREAEYAQNPATGCYMYYFQYLSKTFCVDATKETGRMGRLLNHSKSGNCHTKLHDISGRPHLILVASRDIDGGEELLYDYGDRSKASIAAHPWLKY